MNINFEKYLIVHEVKILLNVNFSAESEASILENTPKNVKLKVQTFNSSKVDAPQFIQTDANLKIRALEFI